MEGEYFLGQEMAVVVFPFPVLCSHLFLASDWYSMPILSGLLVLSGGPQFDMVKNTDLSEQPSPAYWKVEKCCVCSVFCFVGL